MYHIVTGDSGFNALMIVSRLCYIAILKHVLLSVHYNDTNMNICMFIEQTMFESWVTFAYLKLAYIELLHWLGCIVWYTSITHTDTCSVI